MWTASPVRGKNHSEEHIFIIYEDKNTVAMETFTQEQNDVMN